VFAKALDWTDGQKGTEMTRTLSILDKHGVALKQAEGVRL
jgi:hypothetical protein